MLGRISFREGIEPVGRTDALVGVGREEGFGFLDRLIDDWRTGANRFDRPGERFVMAMEDGEVVGFSGLNVDPYVDAEAIGRLRHLYVLPSHRRKGVGSCLVHALLLDAAEHFRIIRLRTANPDAARFYEALGFGKLAQPDASHRMILHRYGRKERGEIVHVRRLEGRDGYKLFIRFSDGMEGVHDFSRLVARSGPMAEPLREESFFQQAFLEVGVPTWPNGFDIDAEQLRREMVAASELTLAGTG